MANNSEVLLQRNERRFFDLDSIRLWCYTRGRRTNTGFLTMSLFIAKQKKQSKKPDARSG